MRTSNYVKQIQPAKHQEVVLYGQGVVILPAGYNTVLDEDSQK